MEGEKKKLKEEKTKLMRTWEKREKKRQIDERKHEGIKKKINMKKRHKNEIIMISLKLNKEYRNK